MRYWKSADELVNSKSSQTEKKWGIFDRDPEAYTKWKVLGQRRWVRIPKDGYRRILMTGAKAEGGSFEKLTLVDWLRFSMKKLSNEEDLALLLFRSYF